MRKVLVALMGFLAVSAGPVRSVRADESCQTRIDQLTKKIAELNEMIDRLTGADTPRCADWPFSLRTVADGFKCRTSKGGIDGKGAVFERVFKENFGEAWKGPDGLIWSDAIGFDWQFFAASSCERLRGALPTRADFERGEADGFREVLPNMNRKDRFYWSSSRHLHVWDYASAFDSESGHIDDYSRYNVEAIRCVGR